MFCWVLEPLCRALPPCLGRCCRAAPCTAAACSCRCLPAVAPPTNRQECLTKVLLFETMERGAQRRIVREMYERRVPAGEILIQEGDTGGC